MRNIKLTLIRPNAQARPATYAWLINFLTVKPSFLRDPRDGADLAVIVGLGGFKSVKFEFDLSSKSVKVTQIVRVPKIA